MSSKMKLKLRSESHLCWRHCYSELQKLLERRSTSQMKVMQVGLQNVSKAKKKKKLFFWKFMNLVSNTNSYGVFRHWYSILCVRNITWQNKRTIWTGLRFDVISYQVQLIYRTLICLVTHFSFFLNSTSGNAKTCMLTVLWKYQR